MSFSTTLCTSSTRSYDLEMIYPSSLTDRSSGNLDLGQVVSDLGMVPLTSGEEETGSKIPGIRWGLNFTSAEIIEKARFRFRLHLDLHEIIKLLQSNLVQYQTNKNFSLGNNWVDMISQRDQDIQAIVNDFLLKSDLFPKTKR